MFYIFIFNKIIVKSIKLSALIPSLSLYNLYPITLPFLIAQIKLNLTKG